MLLRIRASRHAFSGAIWRLRRAAAPTALALIGVALGGCGTAPTQPDVIVVTLDTTRQDHLGVYGYERPNSPELDRFAQDAVVYTRAWSSASWTLPAHASLLTGKHPTSHGAHYDAAAGNAALGDAMADALLREFGSERAGPRVNRLGEDQVTLAELLATAGYETAAFAGGPWLSPVFGLLQGYAHRDAQIDSMSGRSADELTDRALAWLRGVPRETPVHLLVNYFDPHSPYEPPAGYDDWPAAKRKLRVSIDAAIAGFPLPPRQREAYVDRYDGEIRFMDHHLGRLLEALRDGGRYDDALIVIVADHGEHFGEHGLMAHGRSLYEAVLRVPLVVHYPGGRGAGSRVDTPVSVVDVLSWIATELGLEPPDGSEGLPPGARDLVIAEAFRDAHSIRLYGKRFDRDLRSAIRWPWKLVVSDSGAVELFSLADDPSESRNRSGDAIEAPLRAQLAIARSAMSPPARPTPPGDIPPETSDQLRALGYGD